MIKHKVVSIDVEAATGVCARCGPVEMAKKNAKRANGTPYVKWICGVARREQRYPQRRDRTKEISSSGHGLTRGEAIEFKLGKSCEICGSTDRLAVDHCHETGVIRGVLCFNHNAALGLFRDNIKDLQAAIEYLS